MMTFRPSGPRRCPARRCARPRPAACARIRHIASEDLHGGNAEAQGKERLIHGRGDRSRRGRFPGCHRATAPDRSACPPPRRAASGCEQPAATISASSASIMSLDDALKAVLQAEAANQGSPQRRQAPSRGVISPGSASISPKSPPMASVSMPATERAGQEFPEIIDHPAGDGGVVHHQQEAAGQAEPAVDVPLLAGLFKVLVGQDGALCCRRGPRPAPSSAPARP